VDIFAHGDRHDAWLESQTWATKVTDPLLRAIGAVVYAIQTRDGLIKIGYTTDLARRCKQVGYGHESIIGLIQGERSDEQAIHARLDGMAVRGHEWYPWTPPVLAVVNEMRTHWGMPEITEPRAA
jgi:hypothetical protein